MKLRSLITISISISISIFAILAHGEPPNDDYKLTFNDDFEGDALDSSKWSLYGEGKRKLSVVVPDAISLDGKGNLKIEMRKESGDYKTGMVSTQGKFSQKFGYFEAKIKMHSVDGPHGAFWLQLAKFGRPVGKPEEGGVEIDIIEWLQKYPNKAFHTIHWDGYGADHKKIVKEAKIRSADRKFRIYGLEWTEKGYTFFIDDKKTAEIEGPVSEMPQFMILSLILSDWGKTANDRKLPDAMLIDYVRAYAK